MANSKEYTLLTSVEIGDYDSIVEDNSYHQINHSHHKLLMHMNLRDAVIIYDAICLLFALLITLGLENDASAGDVTSECKLAIAITITFAFACGIYGACQRNTWMVGIAVVPCLCLVMVMLWVGQFVLFFIVTGVIRVFYGDISWTSVWFEVAVIGLYLMFLALVGFGAFAHIRYIRGIRKSNP